MPLPQNVNALLGAGVFGIVCAATLYVVEHYKQDRRRHAMAKDLARLDNELTVLRQELNALLAMQKQKYFYHTPHSQFLSRSISRASKRGKRNKKVESLIASSVTSEDYASAVDGDSSDLEFYDVSDDEVDAKTLEKELAEIDAKLEESNVEELESSLERLQNLCMEHPESPHLLWRLGKAHYKLFEKTELQDHIAKGIEACTSALNHKPELADVHKWLAILVGTRTKFQPIKEKILDGHLFKKHVDAAIRLNPGDPTVHHMLGRFEYDLAELKWYERKVAAALFAQPPDGSYDEALEHFKEAERLATHAWKENKLCMAKCYIKTGRIEEAVKCLKEADAIATDNGV
ncbi:hypothetical protein BDFB_012671, partial [Asbolus verrucosus]